MTTGLASPEDDNPLSYTRLDGEWLNWYQVAHRFEHKVPAQDRGDIRHDIIVELALARRRDGDKPFPEARMVRIASFVVADYWRKVTRKPIILSLDTSITNGDGDTTSLIDTIADDKAIDLSAWLDAKTWLLGCPIRLIHIAHKRVNGIPLEAKDRDYLRRFRRKEQKRLIETSQKALS